ncbi:uncharacterized protein EV420DRAFT_211393 [Desarmillaria tabescens]|uniref:Uncharacterized protein n=1 Tax=Armillaria tabescens TaxID=1929756 RepID=A0AA39TUZ7_ARMTA|nr:uncharacterized protein EV420DRAFT_211393 [Desarmillaria tabescens]KAK0460455.1 hypothetical protein EV420DRAFT_211393 [Desarmillaria tabescens]
MTMRHPECAFHSRHRSPSAMPSVMRREPSDAWKTQLRNRIAEALRPSYHFTPSGEIKFTVPWSTTFGGIGTHVIKEYVEVMGKLYKLQKSTEEMELERARRQASDEEDYGERVVCPSPARLRAVEEEKRKEVRAMRKEVQEEGDRELALLLRAEELIRWEKRLQAKERALERSAQEYAVKERGYHERLRVVEQRERDVQEREKAAEVRDKPERCRGRWRPRESESKTRGRELPSSWLNRRPTVTPLVNVGSRIQEWENISPPGRF